MKQYNVVIEKDEAGWYVSEVVELPGCHTQAKTLKELMTRTKEAIKAYLETEEPFDVSQQFVGVKKLAV
ncbi:MAG TPA: type II toxin-antitoxin system HicB family antitoxin [Candidatus Binatia bacterium]|nr:type II toxin-antitoxin system HicB family antitoxin [Candidatus Binatia bacterium]